MKINAIFVDTETSGLHPYFNAILQIAAIRQDGQTFQSYVKPHEGADINPEALAKNGITTEQMKTFPEASVVAQSFLEFLKPQSPKIILAGHNVGFDEAFLQKFYQRQRLDKTFNSMVHYHKLDTLPLAMALKEAGLIQPTYLSLSGLTKALGVVNENEHDALGDVKAAKASYEKMLALLKPAPVGQLFSTSPQAIQSSTLA